MPGVYCDPKVSNELGPNVWDWYFEQPHGTSHHDPMPEVWQFHHDQYPEYFRYAYYSADDAKYKRSVIPRMLKIKPSVTSKAEALFSSYGMVPSKTIGFSYRGNNGAVGDRLFKPISDYFPVLNEVMARHPEFKVWIQTDDSRVLEEFKKTYPDAVRVGEFETIHDPVEFVDRVSPKSGYERGLDAATMMLMLSQCAVLLRNFGNLSDMSAALSVGDDIMLQ
jgi:hypothetical protein